MDHSGHCATALTRTPEGTDVKSEENSGKRKRTTGMDITGASPNASTEQKQLASSYQGLMRQRARRRKVED